MSIPQSTANLMVNELLPRLKRSGMPIEKSPVTPEDMAILAAAKCLGVWSTHEIRLRMGERFAQA